MTDSDSDAPLESPTHDDAHERDEVSPGALASPSITLGSRKSRLALWQAERVADALRAAHPDLDVQISTMDTLGDRIRDVPMPKIGAKGLFTEELERALMADAIDLAVHSLKDLPSTLPEGLVYAGSLERAAPTDALIGAEGVASLDDVPEGATIATGSTRRRAQLASLRPDLRFVDLRGNIGTRLEKLARNDWAGIMMAAAALYRLGRPEVISHEFAPDVVVPAVSQGAIGVEMREGRDDVAALIAPILDGETMSAVRAERIFLRRLEGGCSVPIAAHCRRDDPGEPWTFHGWVGSLDGTDVLEDVARGDDPDALAEVMVEEFIERGARDILRVAEREALES